MSSINGEFSDDRTVEIISNDAPPSPNPKTDPLAALEEENRQLISEKSSIEKQITELNKSISESTAENSKLLTELSDLKAEIKTLGSVAARASELEGDVSRLQTDLIGVTSELDDVNRELRDVNVRFDGLRKEGEGKEREFEAVVAERDLLIEKLREMEVKEEGYLKEGNEKETVIGNLKGKIEELIVEVGNKKDADVLKARVGELERKLEDKEIVINGFEVKERESIVVEGKSGGIMSMDISLVAGAVVCGVGLAGLACYLKAKRN